MWCCVSHGNIHFGTLGRCAPVLGVFVHHGGRVEVDQIGRIGGPLAHLAANTVMGKKKPLLKSSVPRGFATTSVPKREPAPEPKPEPEPEPEPEPPAPPQEPEELDPKAQEVRALQELVDAVCPKVEKETQRKLKVGDVDDLHRPSSSISAWPNHSPLITWFRGSGITFCPSPRVSILTKWKKKRSQVHGTGAITWKIERSAILQALVRRTAGNPSRTPTCLPP